MDAISPALLLHSSAVALLALLAAVVGPQDSNTSAVGERRVEEQQDPLLATASAYAEAMFDRRARDEWSAMIADDFAFVDPTADLWRAPYAQTVRGRDVFRKLEQTWAIDWTRFERDVAFRAGDSVVLAGTIAWKAAGVPEAGPIGFATVLEIADGVVVGRCDYGDYDALATTAPETGLLERAQAYVDALGRGALSELEELLAAGVAFHDETKGVRVDGRFEVLAHLEETGGSAAPRQVPASAPRAGAPSGSAAAPLAPEVRLSFSSTSHAFLSGVWSRGLPAEGESGASRGARVPFALALTFEEGRVREHRQWSGAPIATTEAGDG